MKVAELRAQGWTAIQGDVLTNNLSERIVLSYNGVFAVNNGHHDELEIVDLLWRVGSPPDSFRGTAEYTLENWRPDFGSLSNAGKQYKDNTQCFGESVQKVPSDKMQEALKEADAISEGFLSSSVEVSAKPIFTQAMASAGDFPPVGYKLKFTHDIDGDFSFLHSEKYGWEHGDNLEVIHSTINCHGTNVLIVLNTEPDVLTTAVIINPQFFDNRTEKQKAVDAAIAEWPVADKATLELAYDLWAPKIEQ